MTESQIETIYKVVMGIAAACLAIAIILYVCGIRLIAGISFAVAAFLFVAFHVWMFIAYYFEKKHNKNSRD